MINERITHKTFYIVGMGRSGKAAADCVRLNGGTAIIWDDQKSLRALHADQYTCTSPENVDWTTIDSVILSPGIRYSYPEPHVAVTFAQAKGIPVINDIILFGSLTPQILKIGITGTNGKSTTASLSTHILNGLGIRTRCVGNIGVPVLGDNEETPEAYVVETSSFQLELMEESPFTIAALLNLSSHHLDRHGNMENYINAKLNIFNREAQLRVIGTEDDYTANVQRSLSIRLQSNANILNIGYVDTPKDGVWVYDRRIFIKTPAVEHDFGNTDRYQALRGAHNHQNIASSIGIVLQVFKHLERGIPDWDIIESCLQSFESLPHRQQFVLTHKNVTVINDSKATNVTSAKRSLSAFHNILWLAGGQFNDDEMLIEKKHLKNVVHTFAFGAARKTIENATSAFKPCTTDKTLAEALARAKAYAEAHSDEDFTLLLAPGCVSFDQFTDFEERGHVFIEQSKELFA